MNTKTSTARLLAICWLLAMPCVALAQAPAASAYPAKSVRIIVGFAPGGGTDIVGRIIAQKLTEVMGQSFFVDNRTGASGTIAAEMVAKSAPDGYTLNIAIPPSHSVLPAVPGKVNYDPLRDYAPITTLAKSPMLIVIHPSLPVRSVADLIKVAKARPGQLLFGAGGVGTGPHMAAELFKQTAGIDMLFVAYRGEAPAIADLLGGQISLIFANIVAVIQHVRAGKLRGIAVTAPERIATLPEFPTVAESGLPGYDVVAWYGLLAPAGTAKDIVAKLNAASIRVLSSTDVKEKFALQGLFVSASTPEQLAVVMKEDLAKWAKVIKEANLKLE